MSVTDGANFLGTARTFDGPGAWVLLVLGAAMVIYIAVRPMLKRRDPLVDAPFRLTLKQQKALEHDMQSLLVELSQMVRDATAQLETRSAKLELLIQEADRKIDELRQAGATPADRPAATASPEPEPEPAMADTSAERWAAIYRLADDGKGASEIAREMSMPRGEVELILSLRITRKPAKSADSAQSAA